MSRALNKFCCAGRIQAPVLLQCLASLANWCGLRAAIQFISITSTEERADMQVSASDYCETTILFRVSILAKDQINEELSRPVLPFYPFWLHTLICLNSPELHCWPSSDPHCINMLGFCFRVYVHRSQEAGTDPAKGSMPRACRRGQGLPSDLPKDSLCLHLVVIDYNMFVALPKTACPGRAGVS